MKILTVIPMQEELDCFVQGCVEQRLATETISVGWMSTIYLPQLNLVLAQGGLGKAQFAVQTQYLIDHGADWEVVICAGAAGALDDRLAVGDVVIGSETVEFDINNKFGKPLLPRFHCADAIVDELYRSTNQQVSFKILVGTIASGDEDIVDLERRAAVRHLTGGLVNGWEGAGGARASHFSHLPFIEIRGVSDGANETAPQDFETNLPIAMKNVAYVITAWAGSRKLE
ncbi:MAG: 5'-methylthioadenosine/S-adenosylhomocysteine nucleosidase [Caldilineaceae bacterium]